MTRHLPFENPEWIYEGLDPSIYEKVAGRVTNRAPKQIQANVEEIVKWFNDLERIVRGINISGDGSVQDNRNNIYVVENEIFSGFTLKLPEGMSVNELTQNIVLTDQARGKHYYNLKHFIIVDPTTLEIRTNIKRGTELLIRIWNKKKKVHREVLKETLQAGKAFYIPSDLDYIPTVNELMVQVDGVTQKDVTIEENEITFGFRVEKGREILIYVI